MPSATHHSGLRDNHTRGSVAEFLKAKIQPGSKLAVVSAYFTIYAYDALKECLDSIDHLDFLFGEPSFVNRLDPSKTENKRFIIDGVGLALANKLQQKRVARECAEWLEEKVDVRTIRQANLLHGKLYHIDTGGVEDAILGSSNFTVRGLGLGEGNNNIELNLIVDSARDRQELKQWFREAWTNEVLVRKVSGAPAAAGDPARLNPLAPYYLVFVHDDGTVRFGFAQPKETLLLLRGLAAGAPAAFEKLCDLFDQSTHDGADMGHYDGPLQKALASIEHTFRKRAATSLLSGRGALLPTAAETPKSKGGGF